MEWVGVVVGGDDPALSGLTVAGRDLVAVTAAVLDELGIQQVASPADAVAHGGPVLLLDAHCPLVGADDVARVVAAAVDRPAVGVRPVTDTVKTVRHATPGDLLGETVDRDALVQVAAPLAVPDATVLEGLDGVADLAALVVALRRRTEVVLVEVGPDARRIGDASDLALLTAG